MIGQFNILKEALIAHEAHKLRLIKVMPINLSKCEHWKYMYQYSINSFDISTISKVNHYSQSMQSTQIKEILF